MYISSEALQLHGDYQAFIINNTIGLMMLFSWDFVWSLNQIHT